MNSYMPQFSRVIEVDYRGERYSVRDDGAIMRHMPASRRNRWIDTTWTFGKPGAQTGYLRIASVPVHRIVATAFHGAPPSPQHVVDHVDTNRQNNRPENLRWVTRLENVLLNPISAKRIVLRYGSIEAFLANPSQPAGGDLPPNIAWMRAVSAEDAEASYQRLLSWSRSEATPAGGTIGEWVFSRGPRLSAPRQVQDLRPELVMARTPGAAQRDWRIPAEFPCCPAEGGELSLSAYATNLTSSAVFAQDEEKRSLVVDTAMCDDKSTLLVMVEFRGGYVKGWGLAQVTVEDKMYVHRSLGTFFTRGGAEKEFCLAQGFEWTKGETFDDLC